eukprot:CAMPEP_0201570390 /NCGR_PEP_ID=MMETSP0190_2-20130828/12638_1 /ASSEMBLY_ACC=CAM_ASM_000263 /TAXON_ID=37353 /ORGANISM="Rosalina sp." /LENGTH=795 /DNA_ID=CAMNT_0047993885 /DNA_START=81 /DNA_END=2468 /DNA_ORIENTATION=+
MGSCGTKIQKENIPSITTISNASNNNICCISPPKSPPHIFGIHNELEFIAEPVPILDNPNINNVDSLNHNHACGPSIIGDNQNNANQKVLNLDTIENNIERINSSSPPLSPINLLDEDDEEDIIEPVVSSLDNNNEIDKNQTLNIMDLIPHPTERQTSFDAIGLLNGSSSGSTSSSSSSSFGFESMRETAIASYKRPSNERGSKSMFNLKMGYIQDENKTDGIHNNIDNENNGEEIMTQFDNDGIQPLYDQNINIQNEPLIDLRFNRTLFCEDITYEYQLKCNNLPDIDPFVLRLTVEKLEKYYGETLTKWRQQQFNCNNTKIIHAEDNENDMNELNTGINIPCQFGKVMTPKVFTQLMDNILSNPEILKSEQFGEKTANFLSIPYDIRSIIQYNTDTYFYGKLEDRYEDNAMDFKFYDIICENDDKYKYLCHSQAVYHHDYEYDDCCQCYDQPQIKCYSYWIRSLHHNKIDFLINCTSNNIFTIVMSDLSSNIARILTNDIGIDENSAWIITDYLPKYLLFNHEDNKYNASIIYKYDPRDLIHSDEEIEYFEDDVLAIRSADALNDNIYSDDGQFFISESNNGVNILNRHNIDINDLYNFCHSMRIQHTTLPCNVEMSVSVSEYIESMTRSCNDITVTLNSSPILSDGAYSGGNNAYNTIINQIGGNPEEFGIIKEDQQQEEHINVSNLDFYGADDVDDDDEEDEKYRVFFSAFLDEEDEDDINICRWLSSVQKLPINLNEKQIVGAFKYMLQQNEDNEGYIDYVDFTNFCQRKVSDNDDVKKAQQQINGFISK